MCPGGRTVLFGEVCGVFVAERWLFVFGGCLGRVGLEQGLAGPFTFRSVFMPRGINSCI